MRPGIDKGIRTPQQLRRAISFLSPASPVTDRFAHNWRSLGRRGSIQQEQSVVWYRTQKEHWMGWLREYDGPGAYGRKHAKRSAEFVYNHVVNPLMLIYLAEASGLDPALLRCATGDALKRRSMPAMSSAIRRVIPWTIVETALIARSPSGSGGRPCAKTPVLHLNLHRKYFSDIADGIKCTEFRDRTSYWQKRLEGRFYDVIHFRNGYATKAPEMLVEFRGVKKIRKWGKPCYAIQLGKVLKITGWRNHASINS
jgi:hypothetical protein